MAIVFALFSMGFAGFNDLLFKKYGAKNRPTGILIFIIGIIWTVFFLISGTLKASLVFNYKALLIGLLAGVCSSISNIIFIEAMKKSGAAIGATIYRLNLIFVALLAFILLGESFNVFKISGLLCAITTVILFTGENKNSKYNPTKFVIFALIGASLLRAGMGISYKLAALADTSSESFLAINGACWIIAGLIYAFFKKETYEQGKKVVRYSVLSGFLVCGIVLFLRLATATGDASVVVTISQLSFLITFPLSIFLLKEHFSLKKLLALILAIACIILLSLSH